MNSPLKRFRQRPRIVDVGGRPFVSVGLSQRFWDDIYHRALTIRWPVFFGLIGAIFLLFMLIRRSAATSVTSLMYMTPPTTAVMAWLMFGEKFSLTGALGMVVAVIGVAFVVRKEKAAVEVLQ